MKYILIFLFSISVISLKAQFTGTDSLRNYNNRYITTNPATAFTNNRLNTLLRGIIDFIDTARAGTGGGGALGIDTVFAVNDSTVRYRKNGVFRQFTLKGVYDSRRKVDTIYKSNDTTLTFTVNGALRTVIIPGGTNLNLATADQTATGNRTHNWDNHWLYLNNLKSFALYQDQADANHTDNRLVSQFITDSSIDNGPIRLMWGLKNINDDLTDSLHFELISANTVTRLIHSADGGSKTVEMYLGAGTTYPGIEMFATGNGKGGYYLLGANTAYIQPNDSVFIKAVPKASADSVFAPGPLVNGLNVLYKVPKGSSSPTGPAGGDLTGTYPNPDIAANAVTNSKIAQAPAFSVKGNAFNTTDDVGDILALNDHSVLRRNGTSINFGAINLASSNAVTGVLPLGNLDTTSTNHVVTQSDLKDTAAAIRAAGSGSSTFAGLTDVTVSSPKNGQVPVYDSVTGKWKNQDPVYINIKWFGAVGDSITDDRAAIIKARNYIYNHGGVLFFPAGKWRISDSILFQYPIRIQGVGKSGGLHNNQSGGTLEKDRLGPIQTSTEIIVTNGKNGFVFDRQSNETKAQFTVENLTMSSTVAPGSATGGAFIVIRGMLQGCQVLNSTFYGGYIQVSVESGYYQLIQGCHFSAPQIACIKTGNNIRHDTGDFTVTACTFSSGTFNRTDTTKAIWWFSGGGMRIINNKFDACEFNNSTNFYYHVYAANIEEETSDFIISLNSFENSWSSAIYLRGVVPNYVRNIQITDNQFAPVSSIDPAIDIDKMESVFIDGFSIRDWGHTVSAPAIRVTNSIDVVIGKGQWRDYSSFIDITGTTNWHTDYMHGVDVAIGSKNITNIAGLNSSLYRTITVLGPGTTGSAGAGVVEVASQLPDGDGVDVGYLDGTFKTGGYRVGYIGMVTDGTTTNNRGGKIVFGTKEDNGFLHERMSINNAGKVAIQVIDSVGAPTGGCVFRDAITKELRIAPCGSGSSQWTTTGSDIYYNTGNVFIGKTSGSGFKLDMESSAISLDGIRITNTSSNASARAGIRLVNNGSELGQLSILSSTHSTYPNYLLFEATKSFQIGSDQGVSSGGTSVINFVTGGYSNSPAMEIKGNGHVLINTTTDNGANLSVNGNATVADDAYDAANWNGNFEVPTKNAIRDKIESMSGGSQTWQQTLTTGSTLTGDNTITGANTSFTFNDIFAYRINSDYNVIAKANGTGNYTEAIIGTPNQYWIGYTPTAGSFAKGVGVVIDTNENVGLGTSPPTTMPLYATGASAYVQGLQSNSGNFYRVSSFTADFTAGLNYYFISIDATSGNITMTLPAASTAFGNSMGIVYKIQRVDNSGNTVTVQRAGSDTINGATSFTITSQYQVKQMQCTSTSTWAQW